MANPRRSLEKLLRSLSESTQFATSGSVMPVLPGLSVMGVGAIGSPISALDAQRLIDQATQAPYGLGEATIVDTQVRRVWQFEPSQFTLRNPDWQPHIATIVDTVRQAFGIAQAVTAHLYKLLVYEKDSFFAPHRDTEKLSGMFATLVVCLPSRHEGGALIVRHEGHTKQFDFGGDHAEFKTQFAAFYADCQHEITPVNAGYRICLVYNLAIPGKQLPPAAPQNSAAVAQATSLLPQIFAASSGELNKLIIPFEHQYTQSGLDPQQLKGSDRARLNVLAQAAKVLDYHCYVALLKHEQSGMPDNETMSHYEWGWGSRRDSRPYDESKAVMEEVHHETMTLDHWLDPLGQAPVLGSIRFVDTEILNEKGRESWKMEQSVSEATGNEGVSMERWYHSGVIVMWPADHHFRILASEGHVTAIAALEPMVEAAKKATAKADCRRFAEAIIANWGQQRWYHPGSSPAPERLLVLLERIGTAEIVQQFIRDVLSKDHLGTEGPVLARLGTQFGWPAFATVLPQFIAQQNPGNLTILIGRLVSIVESLCCDPPAMTAERRTVCVALAHELLLAIERWDAPAVDHWSRRDDVPVKIVEQVVHIYAALSAWDDLKRFILHVMKDAKHYPLQEVLIPAVHAIAKWLPNFPAARPMVAPLIQHGITYLRAATAQPVESPTTWTRDSSMLKCLCQDCNLLRKFLESPTQSIERFRMIQSRRTHLENQIVARACDLTYVTDRKGSPQTLVCTKSQASYERRLKQYQIDLSRLAELEAIAGVKPKPTIPLPKTALRRGKPSRE